MYFPSASFVNYRCTGLHNLQNKVRRTERRLSRFSPRPSAVSNRILDKEEKSSAHPLFLTGKTLVFPPVCIPTWLFTPEVRTGTTHQGLRCMNRLHTNPQQDHIGPPSTDNRVQSFNSVMPIAPRAAPSIFPANQNLREQFP